jgi:hypothetical protein
MTANNAGAASYEKVDWEAIHWQKANREVTLCVYNSKTTPPNNLECKAEEKMACPRIQMLA